MNRILRTLNRRWIQHLLFWLFSCLAFLYAFKLGSEPQPVDFYYTLLFHLTLVPMVYVNLRLLIPVSLSGQRYLPYLFWVTALLVLATYFNLWFFESAVDRILPGYYFISYFEFRDVFLLLSAYLLITTLLKLSRGWFEANRLKQVLLHREKEQARVELEALKNQVQPHFLMNTLNGMYGMSITQDARLPDTILQLSNLLRYLLYETGKSKVSLEKELEFINTYVNLLRIRAGKSADIQWTQTGIAEGKFISPHLLLPLVENAFKHGIKGETRSCFMHGRLQVGADALELDLENSQGQGEDPLGQPGGIGLRNLQRQLELLYDHRFEYRVKQDGDVYRVYLRIPLENKPGQTDSKP